MIQIIFLLQYFYLNEPNMELSNKNYNQRNTLFECIIINTSPPLTRKTVSQHKIKNVCQPSSHF